MGGGESARAKGGAWERVVEDGEVVVSYRSTVTAGSANLTKKRRRGCRRKGVISSSGSITPAHPLAAPSKRRLRDGRTRELLSWVLVYSFRKNQIILIEGSHTLTSNRNTNASRLGGTGVLQCQIVSR